MHPMLNIAVQAARQAGRVITRSLDRLEAIDVNSKNRNDFVTQVDLQSELEIIDIIRKAYPDHTILAEESGLSEKQSDYVWIIDPLDGTTNFIHGFPQFAISIALQYRHKLEVAVVYDPLRQELYTAARGDGAQMNNRKIRVSSCPQLSSSLIGTGFPFKKFNRLDSYLKTFEILTQQTTGIRRAGAAALDLAYVACGRLDGFWEMGLNSWDMAAGILLITEAGGLVSDFRGENHYLENGDLVTGNPKIYQELLSIIKNKAC
jgi:myo-inositol-1(or 4)-monophosphatase